MANKTPLWPGGPNIYENVQGDLADKLQSDVTTLQTKIQDALDVIGDKTELNESEVTLLKSKLN